MVLLNAALVEDVIIRKKDDAPANDESPFMLKALIRILQDRIFLIL
jgi:hypothetical protein